MAWCPFATKYELQPESDSQPAIRPTQFIVHSVIAPWTAKRIYEYWRDSTSLESHFGLGYEGDLGQFIGTETRADANAGANRRADGTGAVSIETASNLQGSDPWTSAQIAKLIELGVWLHQRHGIPLRICRTHDDPGFGYHRLFPQWSTSGTACPGDARVRQFKEVVFPGIVAAATNTPPEEDEVTPEEIEQIAKRAAELTFTKLLKTDDVLQAPADAADYATNKFWTLQTHQQDNTTRIRATQSAVAELTAKVGQLETAGITDTQMAKLADLVADRLAARLAS